MNALKNFFSKDNATAKLASYLILVASLLTLAGQYFHFQARTYLIITLISGALATAASLFQSNKVVSNSFWILLLYTLMTYLAGNLTQVWPDAQGVVGFLGAALKLITPFTTQTPEDPAPPTTTKS